MADYSKLTKKELLYTLFARDLMLEERRKENDLQKATINTLIVDHKASQEWYKKQLAEKDEKIEKLKIENHALISDNAYKEADRFELNSFKEYYKNNKISFCIEQLEKVKNNLIDRLADIDEQFMNDIWDEEQYARMCWENWDTNKFIDNLIKEIKDETISN